KKSVQLTSYFEFLLNQIPDANEIFEILTPSDVAQRGCQLSIFMKKDGQKVFNKLTREGVIADWREPNVIRAAPVPLYNTFEEVFRFCEIFRSALR
ncbi:MAG: kynureninase, partial [Bacteroidota bacterium]